MGISLKARWKIRGRKAVLSGALGMLAIVAAGPRLQASDFVKPTKQELEMTSLPGYPGAAAVVLYREEISRDELHVHQHYERIKILTEKGKDYANVELGFTTFLGDNKAPDGDDLMVGDIEGRTIHSDGTIIPFTGKPYLKVVEKVKGYKQQEKVFTLPDAEVGSIIEYRYATRYSDNYVEAPRWYIQGELYVKAAHFAWYPTTHFLTDSETGDLISTVTWFPILPAGTTVEHRELPGGSSDTKPQIYELTIKDVAPTVTEDYMPPIASFSYRVLFNFSQYRSQAEYWKSEGKRWSKQIDKFVGSTSDLAALVAPIVAGASTQDQKLRNIYAVVMGFENTDYTREHVKQEDKAEGLGKVDHAADVFAHKRGNSEQLTELFVGLARAAGMKAYFMTVPDRGERLFAPGWLNFSQFDDLVAIVNVDGKEQFFDPGDRYCEYGQLAWGDTIANGVRQVDGGTALATTPIEPYSANKVTRVAELSMADDGSIGGTVFVTYKGAPALRWREVALRADEQELKNSLKESLEEILPKTLDVRVGEIEHLAEYEQPLKVTFFVNGTMGSPTGKRLVLPAELFTASSRATFPDAKRDLAVYFHYPADVQDAWRLRFPKTFTLEATPEPVKYNMKGVAEYSMTITPAADNVIVRRNYAFNGIIFPPANYAELRSFYSQFEAKDHEPLVLKPAAAAATVSAAPTAGGN